MNVFALVQIVYENIVARWGSLNITGCNHVAININRNFYKILILHIRHGSNLHTESTRCRKVKFLILLPCENYFYLFQKYKENQ